MKIGELVQAESVLLKEPFVLKIEYIYTKAVGGTIVQYHEKDSDTVKDLSQKICVSKKRCKKTKGA